MNPFATPERNRWSAAQALGADDLSREQDYHRAATARTAWAAMGAGVVAGLEVTVDENGDVSVGPGLAIDALGREIVVPSGAGLSPAPEPPFTVWIAHAEVPGRQIPGPDGPEAWTVREEWTLVAVAGVSAARRRATSRTSSGRGTSPGPWRWWPLTARCPPARLACRSARSCGTRPARRCSTRAPG